MSSDAKLINVFVNKGKWNNSMFVIIFITLLMARLLTGCASNSPITKLYQGPDRPSSELSILSGGEQSNGSKCPTTLASVNRIPISGANRVSLLPGTYEVDAYYHDYDAAVLVVAETGVSTTPETTPTVKSSDWTMTLVNPSWPNPVHLRMDDTRIQEEENKQKIRTLQTLSFLAVAGREYVVRCEVGKDGMLTDKKIWIEELKN